MPAIGTGRSCVRCNDAKRKCDRNTPACRLCRRKKLDCVYPNPKPRRFVPIMAPEEDRNPPDSNILDFELPSNDLSIVEAFPGPAGVLADATASSLNVNPSAAWFAAPETFLVDHAVMPLPPNFKLRDLEVFVGQVDAWLRDWVTTGSNTFIHAHLYGEYFPSCLQIAFTTFSAYSNRTPATCKLVLQAVNDQATALVSESNASGSVLQDLALMHALLAYQMIGLFDGDVRSRHLAETRAPFLSALLERTLEKASETLIRQLEGSEMSLTLFNPVSPEEVLWRSWIISESLRRTWLIVQGITASYEGLKQGWAPCNGDVKFTTQEGLWTAESASLWASMCAEKDVRFIGRFHAECLFEVAPGEIDVFAKVMLETVFGKERSLKWHLGVLY
ncbi:hypothetical protein P171DRAFT_437347 [Karstenula rhodostoma CBS 690.94]|uniref:Zn(2)-C6 fungal-type domain-containing protein n=1 Tax=Karstenula rhodostoma CBS 690.94 TaxID=1392251 RepID=A0A9P4P7J2_9PLEO|nr:hypothetical protein P171DRAFT_437347 [Karstenula rhodostoma CBS 690.94]